MSVDQAPAGGPGTSRRAALTAVALLLALVVALLAASAVGPWESPRNVDMPSVDIDMSASAPPVSIDPVLPTLPDEEGAPPLTENPILRWVVVGFVSLLGLVILALLLRFLVALLRREVPPDPEAHLVTVAGIDDAIDAPAILDGIARAQDALASERPPRDAVIEAWLALEHAATDAGVGRKPAQTPTEFTATVLERTPADRGSVDLLRGLYTRVRFSDEELHASDAEAAHEALTAIATSWSALEVPR